MSSWENPYWCVLFLILPFIWGLRLYLSHYRKEILKRLPVIVAERSAPLYLLKTLLLSLAWIGLTVALMGPIGNHKPMPNFRDDNSGGGRQKPQDVVMLMDASASMSVKDGRGGYSRLEDAKEIAELVIGQLQGQNVALYAFTSDLAPLSPATPDYLFTILTLRSLKINEGDSSGTKLYDAVERIYNEYKEETSDKKHTLIIFTDGEDNSTQQNKILEAISNLRKLDWEVFIVGLGSPNGGVVPNVTYKGKPVQSKLEEAWLRKVAEAGQGDYYSSYSMNSLELSKSLGAKVLASNRTAARGDVGQKAQEYIFDRYFQWPLILALLALLAFFFIPDTTGNET